MGLKGWQHTKAAETEALIKGTPQSLSGKQALVKVCGGRWSFRKCELYYYFMTLLQSWGKEVLTRRQEEKTVGSLEEALGS